MPLPLFLLMTMTVLESVASALIQTGIFFYTQHRLGFTATDNLLLAVLHGSVYIAGALASHPVSARLGERRTLLTILGIQATVTAALPWLPGSAAIWFGSPVLLALYGVKWPVVETFVVAGRTPRQASRVIGRFNVTWSTATAMMGLGMGALIALGASPLFYVSAAMTLGTIVFCARKLPTALGHLAHDHPERPDPQLARHYGRLLRSARWSLLVALGLQQIAMPLLPSIMNNLGVGVVSATALATLMFWSRTAAFAWMGARPGWHGKKPLLAVTALALPASAIAILHGASLASVLIAQVVFGAAGGVAYMASLYYAMVIKNASVDAGGAHEAIIGSGFVAGPLVGLLSRKLSAVVSPALLGMTLGLSPLIAAGLLGGLWPLRKAPDEDGGIRVPRDADSDPDADADRQPADTGATACETSATRPGATANT